MQTGHMRVLSENIANYKSTAETSSGDPYSRKIAVFKPAVPDGDDSPVGRIVRDTSGFRSLYDPSNAVADAKGMVKFPDVNLTVESSRLQELIRSYELNLSASSSIDKANQATIDLLR